MTRMGGNSHVKNQWPQASKAKCSGVCLTIRSTQLPLQIKKDPSIHVLHLHSFQLLGWAIVAEGKMGMALAGTAVLAVGGLVALGMALSGKKS